MGSTKNTDFELLKEVVSKLAFRLNDGANNSHKKFSNIRWNIVGNAGILGLMADKEYGGLGLDLVTSMKLMETLARTCEDAGLVFSVITQLISCQVPLMEFGNEEQKEKYMSGLIDGSIIGAHAISEPDSGSDAYAMKTTARRCENDYILSGSKIFVTNAPIADLIVLYAMTDPDKGIFGGVSAFLVESNTPGLEIGKPIEKMGLTSSPFGELFFDECKIKSTQLLGKEGAGYRILEFVMAREILLIAASHIGEMKKLISLCIKYSKLRKQYGKPISNNQAISHKIVDMRMSLEASETVLYSTANDLNLQNEFKIKLSVSKLLTSENYVKTALDAVQIFGAYGYTKEYGIEKHVRHSVASRIYSGTSEVHRNIIANFLGL